LDEFYQITTKSATETLHALYNHLNIPINMLVNVNINNRTFFSKCFYNHIMALRCVVDGGRCVLCASNHFFGRDDKTQLETWNSLTVLIFFDGYCINCKKMHYSDGFLKTYRKINIILTVSEKHTGKLNNHQENS
jgi:hypothetical protein